MLPYTTFDYNSAQCNPSPRGGRGRRARSPVSKVATDCKAGVKFDLVGHKRRDGSEGQYPSNSFSKHGMTTDSLYWEAVILCQKLLNSPKDSDNKRVK